jgi:hypothetical protein
MMRGHTPAVGLGRRAWVALCTLLWVPAVWSHTLSESHSNWRIDGRIVHLTFTVPNAEARRLGTGGAMPAASVLGGYIAKHVTARSNGLDCVQQQAPEELSSAPVVQQFEITFQCPLDRKFELGSSAFFELVPSHTNYAQIQTESGEFVEQLITRDRPVLDVTEVSGHELESAGFFTYVGLGIWHIFTGTDHQAFLLGLILLSRRLKDLVFVITGFTIGHSLTLALAVTGILRPHAEYIDALIGLTIALVGSEIVAGATGRRGVIAVGLSALLAVMALGAALGLGGLPTLLLLGAGLAASCYLMISGRVHDAVRLRMGVTVVFGLIHGFGFAAGLLEMRLPAKNLAELLFGFNLGVEIGQLSLVLTVVGLAALAVRVRVGLPRRMVADVASMLLVAVGLFWFVTRSYV